jgi:hypothetical protein
VLVWEVDMFRSMCTLRHPAAPGSKRDSVPYERWSGRNGRKAAIGAAVFALSARAAADPEGLELSWTAPPGCPGENEVLVAVEQLVGERKGVLHQPLWAQGSVVSLDGRFRLDLSWRTASAEAVRTVEGDTCAEVSQAAAVIIALAMDPTTEQSQPDPSLPEERSAVSTEPGSVQPPLPPSPPPQRTDAAPQPDEQKRPTDDAMKLGARAAFALDLGTLPSAAPGGLLGARLSLSPFAVVLDGLTFVPVEREVIAGAGEFWLSAFSLRPCWAFVRSAFRAEPCAALEAHVVRSKGKELSDPDERWAWFARFGLTVEAAYRLNRALSVVAGGALLAAPSRPTFVIEEVSVHEPATLSGRLTLGFELTP